MSGHTVPSVSIPINTVSVTPCTSRVNLGPRPPKVRRTSREYRREPVVNEYTQIRSPESDQRPYTTPSPKREYIEFQIISFA